MVRSDTVAWARHKAAGHFKTKLGEDNGIEYYTVSVSCAARGCITALTGLEHNGIPERSDNLRSGSFFEEYLSADCGQSRGLADSSKGQRGAARDRPRRRGVWRVGFPRCSP